MLADAITSVDPLRRADSQGDATLRRQAPLFGSGALPKLRSKQPEGYLTVLIAKDFDEFWEHYPRRVGKLAARKAYERVRKSGVTQETLLDGIAAYVKHKPAYADFCHPSTWLCQGRWLDEWTPAVSQVEPACDWWDECKRLHANACNGRIGHANQMHIDAERERRGMPPHPVRQAVLDKERQGVPVD